MTEATDVHQHLWPAELIDRLRARAETPYLRGWTLHTAGESPYEVDPVDHDPVRRIALDRAAGVGSACLSLSAPLGLESLPRAEADVLLGAWHRGLDALPDHFGAWASVPTCDPDLPELTRQLASGRYVGLQLPATQLLTPAAWARAADVLRVAELADKPVLVHPGPVTAPAGGSPEEGCPGWWAPVVDYVAQQQAAWWAWHAIDGRAQHPGLQLVFAAAAGLAPVHTERHRIRGGQAAPVDPHVYVDTSGYGARALDAVVRVLGIDALVLGSDRPYAEGIASLFGDAATHAVRVSNPRRLLDGTSHSQTTHLTPAPHRKETPTWAFAS